jgi:hypothetical protein
MRSSKSRSRNKSNRQRSLGNIVNRVFDSSGPEGKVRGTPQQIIDKYLMLARDAQLSNDRVSEQAFLQHAEHYSRMLGEAMREMAREQEGRQAQQGQNGNGNGGTGNGNGGYGHQGDRPDRNDRPERYDPRPPRDSDDDQPDFAPLGIVEREERASDLVETPEMHHSPQPAAFEGHLPDFLGAPAAPADARPPRNERRPRGGDAAPAAAPDAPAKPDRGPRGPRGPRRQKPDAAAELAPRETPDGE